MSDRAGLSTHQILDNPHVDFTEIAEFSRNQLNACFEWFGEIGFFPGWILHAAVTPPYELRELTRQFDEVGSKSALLIALARAATGAVLSVDTRDTPIRFGTKSSLPIVFDKGSATHRWEDPDGGRTCSGRSLAVILADGGMKSDSDEALVLTQAQAMNVRNFLVKNFRRDDTRVKPWAAGKARAPRPETTARSKS